MGKFARFISRSINCIDANIRKRDIFGVPVSLNFKGEETFKTTFGGLITLICIVISVNLMISEVRTMITRDNTVINTSTLIRDLINDSTEFKIGEDGFRFGLAVAEERGQLTDDFLLETEYLNFTMFHHRLTRESIGSNNSSSEFVDLGLKRCDEEFSEVADQQTILNIGFDRYRCPEHKNYTLGGNIYSEQLNEIIIRINRCTNGSSIVCKSDAEIDTFIRNKFFNLGLSNFYFDGDDYDDPIKPIIDDKLTFTFIPGLRKEVTIFMKINEATDNYDYAPFSSPRHYTYYENDRYIEQIVQRDSLRDKILLRVKIMLDEKSTKIERSVYSFNDMIGQVGGSVGFIVFIGSMIASVYTSTAYFCSLVSEFYHCDEDDIKPCPKEGLTKVEPFKKFDESSISDNSKPMETSNKMSNIMYSSSHSSEDFKSSLWSIVNSI